MNERKPKNKVCSCALAACAFILAGCAQQQQSETVERICPAGIDKQRAFKIAEDVLGEMHFSIAKSDADLGVIITRPLTAAQFFEFWRKDNVDSFSSAEANLHTIRRIAELNIDQQDTNLCIRCRVNTQRLRLPEREIRSSARAYDLFSQSGSSRQVLKLNPEQQRNMTWVDLGDDSHLAAVILQQIENKIDKMREGKTL
jgi:hypothetical protein